MHPLTQRHRLPNRVPVGLNTWLQIIRTFSTFQAKIEDSLKRYKLSLAQFDLMAMLVGLGDLNQQELADELAVTKGNMVGLVNRLSRRGFVKRIPAQKGRRMNIIRLTSSGRKLVEAALPEHWRLIRNLTSPLTATELNTLRVLLERLEHRMPGSRCE